MAQGIVVLQLFIREVMFDPGTTKDHPLLPSGKKKKKKEFLKGCCHHPQVDNNSESKCKLRCGEILSARLQAFKRVNFQGLLQSIVLKDRNP